MANDADSEQAAPPTPPPPPPPAPPARGGGAGAESDEFVAVIASRNLHESTNHRPYPRRLAERLPPSRRRLRPCRAGQRRDRGTSGAARAIGPSRAGARGARRGEA